MLDPNGQPLAAFNAKSRATREVDELIGLCKGIVADGVVNEDEARFLQHWLHLNRESRDIWPCSVLYPRIESMLSDGKLTAEEERELLGILIQTTGGNPVLLNAHSLSAGLPLDEPAPLIAFGDQSFCFSGKMLCGPRKACEAEVLRRRGSVIPSIRENLSFLVIGAVGSRDWIHSTFGRKIEQAVEYRSAGAPLKIVCEEHFVRALD